MIRQRFRSLLWRPRPEDEVAEEVAFHIEMRARELVAQGLDEETAQREARQRFGNLNEIAQDCRRIAAERNRRMFWLDWLDDLKSDLKYATRQLVRRPSLTLAVMLTLGIGIGANTTIFNIINGVLLRPLPVPDGDELVVLAARQPEGTALGMPVTMGLSLSAMGDVREATTAAENAEDAVFTDLAAFAPGLVGIATDERAEQTLAAYVSGNFFSLLGLEAFHGRLILPNEGEVSGADPVVVLGHTFWQRHMAADPGIVGQTLRLNGSPYTVVGVAPKDFLGPMAMIDMGAFLPLAMHPQHPELAENRDSRQVRILGRLAPGVTFQEAEAALDVVAVRLGESHPVEKGYGLVMLWETLSRPEPPVAGSLPVSLGVFMALVSLVLLVACFNVANLLLLRATQRRSEIAVRSAMGARRGRLIRQLLTESILLSALGGVTGVALAVAATRYIESIPLSDIFPVVLDFGFDGRVAAFVTLVVLVVGFVAGLLPALRASRVDLAVSLHEQGRSAGGSVQRHVLRNALVVSQVAISLLLLMTAGLFVRVARAGADIDLGFTADGVLKVHVDPSQVGYDEERTAQFFKDLRNRAAALPGVVAAGVSYSPPMGHYGNSGRVAAEGTVVLGQTGEAPPADEAWTPLFYNSVDPHYFETLEMPLVGGRAFDSRDTVDTAPVAIVNEHLAETLWPAADAIGRRFHLVGAAGDVETLEVVGVTKNARYLLPYGAQRPYLYVPQSQQPTSLRVLFLRTDGPVTALAPMARSLLRSMEPSLAPSGIGEVAHYLDNDVNGFFLPRMGATVASAIGILGLILATVGLYGVVAWTASQRRQEIGVRMALGANRRMIVRMVIRQGLVLVSIGLGVGMVFALGMTSLVGSMIFQGGNANDPATILTVVGLLLVAALAACWLPARRASGLDVTAALRCD